MDMDTIRRVSNPQASTDTPSQYGSDSEPPVTVAQFKPRSLFERLPDEVLGEIFLLCLQFKGLVFHRTHDLLKEAPMLLCLVCSHWRSTALTIPALWNRLSLSIYLPRKGYDGAIQRYSELVARQISRTGAGKASQRLSLAFDFLGLRGELPRRFIRDIVFPNLNQCSHLHLRLRDGSPFAPLPRLESGNVEHLESLILERDVYRYWAADFHPVLTGFDIAPRLRKVSTCFVAFQGQKLYPLFPWSQLTFLNICEPLTASRFEALLISCTNLEKGLFVIEGTDSFPESFPSTNPIPLKISDLTLTYTYDGFLTFFDGFSLPALTKLRFHAPVELDCLDFTPHFLSQMHRLRKLSIVGEFIDTPRLRDVLEFTPSLMELELDHYLSLGYEDVFRSLDRSESSLLPQLETLTIYVPQPPPEYSDPSSRFPYESLVDMVKSRSGQVPAISCFIFLHSPIYKEVLKEAASMSSQIVGISLEEERGSPRFYIQDMDTQLNTDW